MYMFEYIVCILLYVHVCLSVCFCVIIHDVCIL